MKYYLGVTDWRWYNYLGQNSPEDVNFWQPGGRTAFRALEPGGPFLFKLKSPYNAIGGIGFFAAQSQVPLSVAWDTFGQRNGFETLEQFRAAIQQIRGDKDRNPTIGCIALTNPIFFRRQDWIPLPVNWSNSIVVGKGYDTNKDSVDAALWQQVQAVLARYQSSDYTGQDGALVVTEPAPLYGAPVLRKVRIGQGAFRLSVTDAYAKRCAITGEKTLPVLEAAHIRPYAEAGPNTVTNGLLLRSDMHKLFDDGYITVAPNYKIEVSQRIREEFENGREYYQYHGKELLILPTAVDNRPNVNFLEYHNTTIFRA
ncbi:HNH endonuclease [Hymenobacter sp. BT186]|uniref:HNH endonuclease n=1 Tax=Hymenobacter telluris TaxID=2816474 RepID=A0A939J996_9BACT|nr:HNH endonuclease [Hymenobacter telluris]MBO0356831.1 HNH endonuclease [Hymenobacter telluris]MBW3372857.1 HNH endonuclease [Hymenobacter norwichensis]